MLLRESLRLREEQEIMPVEALPKTHNSYECHQANIIFDCAAAEAHLNSSHDIMRAIDEGGLAAPLRARSLQNRSIFFIRGSIAHKS